MIFQHTRGSVTTQLVRRLCRQLIHLTSAIASAINITNACNTKCVAQKSKSICLLTSSFCFFSCFIFKSLGFQTATNSPKVAQFLRPLDTAKCCVASIAAWETLLKGAVFMMLCLNGLNQPEKATGSSMEGPIDASKNSETVKHWTSKCYEN